MLFYPFVLDTYQILSNLKPIEPIPLKAIRSAFFGGFSMSFQLGFFLIIMSAMTGCSDQNFSAGSSQNNGGPGRCKTPNKKECTPPPLPPPTTPPFPPPPSVEHEAVFAVRNMSCAFCHAKIESNIISDFASKTTPASAAQSLDQLYELVQDKRNNNIKPQISGKFIIPDVTTRTSPEAISGGVSTCVGGGLRKTAISYPQISLSAALDKCLKSFFVWGNPAETFVTRKTVDINPVSSPDSIKAIAANESAKLSSDGFAVIGTSTLSGLTGSKAAGFKSKGAISCEGAVVFDAPVMLENSTISTQKGCRIYSTGSIFVFGSLVVSGPAESAHLQLMSPVFVGFDILPGDAVARINHDANNHQAFSIGSSAQVGTKITADGKTLSITAKGSGSNSYSKVAASAPVIYSRSSGQFSGVIIAEQFIGKIGSLSFKFDPIFKKSDTTPVLFPEIKTPLVTLSDD